MSHKPPIPDAATSPFPLHPAPIEHDAPVGETPAETSRDEGAGAKISGRTLGIAAGAAIGSAAVAAALLFYNRPPTPAKRPVAKPKSRAKHVAKPAAASKPAPASKSKPAASKPRARKPKSKPASSD
jgi:hypothetical protein